MLGQLAGQVYGLVGTPLWYHHDAADLLHLGVVWRAHPIQVSCNLKTRGSGTHTTLSCTWEFWKSALFPSLSSRTSREFHKMQAERPAAESAEVFAQKLLTDLTSDSSPQKLPGGHPGICTGKCSPVSTNTRAQALTGTTV